MLTDYGIIFSEFLIQVFSLIFKFGNISLYFEELLTQGYYLQ